MLTYQEQIELREKVANDEIAIELAKEIYWKDFKEGNRAWHTEDWKERRSKFIKDKCEICGRNEGLTLQHLSHPKKYYEYEKDVTIKYTEAFNQSDTIIEKSELAKHIRKNFHYEPILLCPNCESKNPSRRMKKTPKYICKSCSLEFDSPAKRMASDLISTFYENQDSKEVRDRCFVSKDKWRNKQNISEIRYWLQREKTKIKSKDIIEKESFLLYLDDNIKYLSFEETITACKRCAFNFDINNLELCPNCKEFYKGIHYPICIHCLPEDKRKIALEKVEFGRGWRDMEKELGID
jgi:hypothetical protein